MQDTGNPYVRWSLITVLADGSSFVIASALAWMIVRPDFPPAAYALAIAGGTALALMALVYCEAYAMDVITSGWRTFYSVALAMGLAFLTAIGVYFLVAAPAGVIESMAHVSALFFPLLLVERALLRRAAVHPSLHDRTLVVGASELGVAIAQLIRQRGKVQLVGFLSDRQELVGGRVEGAPVLGKAHEVGKIANRLGVDRVVVASKDRDEFFPADDLFELKAQGVRIDSGIEFFEQTSGRVYMEGLRPSYLIFSQGFNLGFVGELVKRICDVMIAAVGLALSAPVLAILAVAIKLTSRGPVFYRQERVGRGGRLFRILKLRTMADQAEAATGAVLASAGDARVTFVGRLLRASRLDEVPQFWNVLTGDMSLVGPRPERPEFVEELSQLYPYFRWRTCVKPGITGWAQIRYGYVNEFEAFEQKLSLDLFYLKHRTLAFDLFIIWETVKTAVLLRGL